MAQAQSLTSMKEIKEQIKGGVKMLFTSAPMYLPMMTIHELGISDHLFTGHCS